MIAEVAPYARTIRGKDFFDYRIPDGMNVTAGSIVQISFRRKPAFGLVVNVKEQSAHKRLLSIDSVYEELPAYGKERLELLRWFAEYYAVSIPHAWKTMQFTLLKRPRKNAVMNYPAHASKLHIAKNVVEQIQKALKDTSSATVLYNNRETCLAYYRGLVESAKGNVLCIVPEQRYASEIIRAVDSKRVVQVSADSSPSDMLHLEQALQERTDAVVIGTRRLAFLNPELFSTVVMDQEHARSHKQYDLNPRYHVRDVLMKTAELFEQRLILTGASLSTDTHCAVKDGTLALHDMRNEWSPEHIRIVDMSVRQSGGTEWFSQEALEVLTGAQKSIVLFNRIGSYDVAVCNDCGEIQQQDDTCKECKSIDLKRIRKGVKQLYSELQQQFPDKTILRCDSETDATPQQIAGADIVIATEKVLSSVALAAYDILVIVSIDHQLVYPHFRALERTYNFLTQLFTARVPQTVLQTYNASHTVIRAAFSNEASLYMDDELNVRKQFSLPPYAPSFRIIDKEKNAEETVAELPDTLPSSAVIDRQ